MTRSSLTLSLACLAAGQARAAEPAPATGPKVQFATAARGFLDRGRDAGLAIGSTVQLANGTTCVIDRIADHFASCPVAGIARDLPYTWEAAPGAAGGETAAESERAKIVTTLLRDAPHAKIGHRPRAKRRLGRRPIELTFAQQSFTLGARRSWQRSGLHLSVRDLRAPEIPALRLDAEVTAEWWLQRPSVVLFRPEEERQFYIWDLVLAYEEEGLLVRVGRFQPWHTPGLIALDGAQLGWRDLVGTDEIGLYAGLVPDPLDFAGGAERWTAGTYVAGRTGAGISYANRLSLVSLRPREVRLELQSRLGWRLGDTLDAAIEPRVALLDGWALTPSLAGVRGDIRVLPRLPVSAVVGVRYDTPTADALDGSDLFARQEGERLRGDAAIQIRAVSGIVLRTLGAASRELNSDRSRLLFGEEIQLPRVGALSLQTSLGYREELGWIAGRTFYMYAAIRPLETLGISGRASYFKDALGPASVTRPFREVGLSTRLDFALAEWLLVDLSLFARLGLNGPRGGGIEGDQTALIGSLSLTARL